MSKTLAIHGGSKVVPERLKKRWPDITEEDKRAIMEVLDSGILWGPYAPQAVALEREFADYIGRKYCITFNSGTAALHAAVKAAGVGPGDEVITCAFTFLASAAAVLHHNGIPVFVDIDPNTYNIDAKKIEEKVSDKTKAIIPVHLHGIPADLDEIMELAKKHNLVLIEDAAQAHGSEYKGKKAGTFGDMAIFSLNSTKNLPGGEGGLFVTDREDLRGLANMVRLFGEYMKPGEGRSYVSYTMGWNYRNQEMPAAFARSQLRRLDWYNENSRKNGEFLSRELGKIDGLEPPYVPPDRTTNYYKYRLKLDSKKAGLEVDPKEFRNKVLAALRAEGADVAVWQTTPLTANPLFQEKEGYGKGCPFSCPFYGKEILYRTEDYPETIKLLDSSIVVGSEEYPLFPQKLELMEYYVEAFKEVFAALDVVMDIDLAAQTRTTTEGRAEEL